MGKCLKKLLLFGLMVSVPLVVSSLGVAGTTSTSVVNDPNDPSAELVEKHRQQQEVYQSINALNPFSTDYGKQAKALSSLNIPGVQNLVVLEKLLSNPLTQKPLQLLSNAQFQGIATTLVNHPNRNNVFGMEIAWLIFFIFFKAWRASKMQFSLLKSIGFKLWTTALYIGVSSGVIPLIGFGSPYEKAIHLVFNTFSK